jgi:hypothetical protein
MRFFTELGNSIDKYWRNCNYSEASFPAIAAQALAETIPDRQPDPWEVIRWLFTASHLPRQQDMSGEFGDLALTLYSGSRFHIDLYLWLDGTTSVHQHSFCGAFQVLLGSSIHSQYSFVSKQKINDHFVVGETTLQSNELLEAGAVKQILPGKEYIHSLFHLDRPSATICVRTYFTPSSAPQYDYSIPFFAIDPFFNNPLITKQTQSVTFLLGLPHPKAEAMIADLLSRSDFAATVDILSHAKGYFADDHLENSGSGEDRFQMLLDIARQRHGALVDTIPPVFAEAERQNNLIRRRRAVVDKDHRFFLALLLNVSERASLLELVKHRFPDHDPVDIVTGWVANLANTKVFGSQEPNVLGIADYSTDYLFVLRCLFKGLSLEETQFSFKERGFIEQTDNSCDRIKELYDSIVHSMIFKSIFRGISHDSSLISDEAFSKTY